jgi:hypothetical protein
MTPLVNLEEITPDGFPPRQRADGAAGTHRPVEQS